MPDLQPHSSQPRLTRLFVNAHDNGAVLVGSFETREGRVCGPPKVEGEITVRVHEAPSRPSREGATAMISMKEGAVIFPDRDAVKLENAIGWEFEPLDDQGALIPV